jgi:hypothetical protein
MEAVFLVRDMAVAVVVAGQIQLLLSDTVEAMVVVVLLY